MTDIQIQRKLNQLTKIANELTFEARSRFPDGQLFYECEGRFHFMNGDNEGCVTKRRKHVLFSSNGVCLMDCGAW